MWGCPWSQNWGGGGGPAPALGHSPVTLQKPLEKFPGQVSSHQGKWQPPRGFVGEEEKGEAVGATG